MKIVLVRHGRPDEGHAERPHDPPLADEGCGRRRPPRRCSRTKASIGS
jgi:hypothetical protein